MKTTGDTLNTLQVPSVSNMLINGARVPALSGKTFQAINPATGAVLTNVAQGAKEDVDIAVTAARRAFQTSWGKFKPFERQSALLKLADLIDSNFDELAWLDTIEMGAPVAFMAYRRTRLVSMIRYYAGLATAIHGQTLHNSQPGEYFSYTLKEPMGVVAAITPWNGPMTAAIWKLAPALASGCCVILKPAEQSVLSALRIAELCLEAGIPNGAVNVVTGFGDAGAALAAHPGVDKVAFTGSTEVGQSIVRASAGNLKRVSVELGGKSPNIIFSDADLDKAVPSAAMAIFFNSGQVCAAGSRLYVQKGIYEEFMQRLVEYSKSMKVGDPLDHSTQLGPLVSSSQLDRVQSYVESGITSGARPLTGGKRLTSGALANGNFFEPTIFGDVIDTMPIAREEIFGPIVAAMPFETFDEVVQRANDTIYGLGAGVWTRDLSTAHQAVRALQTGTVWINCYTVMDTAVPFGGYKMSGYGKESGIEHLEEFLQTKAAWINEKT